MNTFASSPVRRTCALLALALLAALAACEDNIPSGEAPPPPAKSTASSPSIRRGLPSRAKIEAILAAHGYHLLDLGPQQKVLKGRMLWECQYTSQAAAPETALICVYVPLRDQDGSVLALATSYGGSRPDGLPEWLMPGWNSHARQAPAIIQEITGLSPERMPVDARLGLEINDLGQRTAFAGTMAASLNGFRVETIDVRTKPKNGPGDTFVAPLIVIVRDSRWSQVP